MNEQPSQAIETKLEFHGKYLQYILGGTKRVSIRMGHRNFSKDLEVSGFRAKLNYQKHTVLKAVPFSVFESEGWTNMLQVMFELRKVYPTITWDTPVTIVEFHINIPPDKVKK